MEWIMIINFERDQQIVQIGDVEFGGQPGELPTVLIGSLFYQGQKILEDPIKGIFAKSKAEELINTQEELSEQTGIPHCVDVVGETPEAIIRALEFVAETTEAPLLIGGVNKITRLAGASYVKDVGLESRAVYNTLGGDATDEEIKGIREIGIKSGILLAYSIHHLYPKDKVKLLLGSEKEPGLLDTANQAGFENILVDTAVIDMPGVVLATEAIYWIKKELGIPTGTAPTNSIDNWTRIKEFTFGSTVCYPGISIFAQTMGADFIFYGAIERAPKIFPACAMTDALIAYRARIINKIRPKTKEHPLYKIF